MQIPPLSQSKQKLLACPHSYVEQIIRSNKEPANEASNRGTAIHAFLCGYVRHLVKRKLDQDIREFDAMLRGMEPSAREILKSMREFTIDPEMVFATEQHIWLNEQFLADDRLGAAHYEMTLDLIELVGETAAKITDYKSQYEAVDPDTFQARLYSLGLMMLNPQIQQVEFELRFLRWGKQRSVTFTREDIPRLQDEAAQWRQMQVRLHDQETEVTRPLIRAIPGNHCIYCPLLANGCPVPNNPANNPQDLLQGVLYAKQVIKQATPILKAFCDEHGPLHVSDGTGVEYVAHWEVQERKSYGIDVLPVVMAWEKEQKDSILPKLTVSGLSSILKTKKRADLADECANLAEIKPTPTFKIGKAGEQEEED